MKRFLTLLLAVVIVFSMLPVPSAAAETAESPEQIGYLQVEPQINPLYAGIIDVEDLEFPEASASIDTFAGDPVYLSEDDAADLIREYMKERIGVFTIYVRSTEDYNILFDRLLNKAMEHTGDPEEGDYLRYQYGGRGGSMQGSWDGSWYYYTFTYTIPYYTTEEQEEYLEDVIDDLLDELDLEDCSDFEKVRGVYDYICDNITYDYANLGNSSYKLMRTAYGALVNKTVVCQGYAVLLYRLLLELDVDNRIVTGIGNGGSHAWNIVELDGLYYNADSTWDASWRQSGLAYDFFLRNEMNFTENNTNHIRDTQFDTAAFHAAYPMSETDYDLTTASLPAHGICGENLTWELDTYGTLIISGTGQMRNYRESAEVPWFNYLSRIQKIILESGVTTVAMNAFTNAVNLRSVEIGKDVTAIFSNAFGNCESLNSILFTGDVPGYGSNVYHSVTATAYYPADNSTWTYYYLDSSGGTLTFLPSECYEVVGGPGNVVEEGAPCSIQIKADHSAFTALYINGRYVPPACYTIHEDTIITFTEKYLATLELGEYPIVVHFTNGLCVTTLTIVEASATALTGDLNADGNVDSDDLTLLARHVGGIELVSGLALANADVNGDGLLNSDDLTLHARYVGGIITDWTADASPS